MEIKYIRVLLYIPKVKKTKQNHHSKCYHVEKMLKVQKALIMARLTCYILTLSVSEMGAWNMCYFHHGNYLIKIGGGGLPWWCSG